MSAFVHISVEWPMKEILTANQRLHWAPKAKRTKALREHFAARSAWFRDAHMERAHVLVTVGWPDHRRRDVHNIFPTIKACIDGMVDGQLFDDDSDAHLVGPDLRAEYAGVKGHVVLTFTVTELPIGETV